jgi:hypothetical protein
MKKNNNDLSISDKKIADLNTQRIKKHVIEETDPDVREEVEDFLKRFKDDTLTGL